MPKVRSAVDVKKLFSLSGSRVTRRGSCSGVLVFCLAFSLWEMSEERLDTFLTYKKETKKERLTKTTLDSGISYPQISAVFTRSFARSLEVVLVWACNLLEQGS